jgi:hypothetical protein
MGRSRTNPADSLEVDFAIVLARTIESVKADPAELRNIIYEAARIRLQREVSKKDPTPAVWELRRLNKALETAIERVETLSSRQDQLEVRKSADRLIASFDPVEAVAPANSPQQVLLLDDAAAARGRTPLLAFWALRNCLPFLVSRARVQVRLTPVLRVLVVAAVAVAVYGAFRLGDNFLPQSIHGRDKTVLPDGTASAPQAKRPEDPNVAEPTGAIARQPAAMEPRDFPLPTFYGIYAINNGQLYELEALPGKVPDPRIFMSGVMTKPSRTVLPGGQIAFVVFRRDLAANPPNRASVRVIAKIVRAMSFTGRKPNLEAVEDAWAVRKIAYDFRVAPLGDQPEMLVIRPEDRQLLLAPGRYGLVLKDVAYDFTVSGEITDPAQCLERTEAANGTFYSECRKP